MSWSGVKGDSTYFFHIFTHFLPGLSLLHIIFYFIFHFPGVLVMLQTLNGVLLRCEG